MVETLECHPDHPDHLHGGVGCIGHRRQHTARALCLPLRHLQLNGLNCSSIGPMQQVGSLPKLVHQHATLRPRIPLSGKG